MLESGLVISAFVAGLFTFLAPCTLPLVPGFLSFIAGASPDDASARKKVFLNGIFYVLGFSVVFVIMGTVISFISGSLFFASRLWLSRIGGVFVMFFGLFLVYQALVFFYRLPLPAFLTGEKRIHVKGLKPGNPVSSAIFGATFAFGWTPCVGPVLGAILTLAATNSTVGQGAFLLAVFSAGLAVPFLVLAAGWGTFAQKINKLNKILPIISLIGGIFIFILGLLVLTNTLGIWTSFFFKLFGFINYEGIYDFL